MKVKMKNSIALRMSFAFGILLLAAFVNMLIIHHTSSESQKINRLNKEIFSPSVNVLQKLYMTISRSKLLIKNWVYVDKQKETPDKIQLKNLHKKDYPELKKEIAKLAKFWDKKSLDLYNVTIHQIDSLFARHKNTMELLSSFSDYEEPTVIWNSHMEVDTDGPTMILSDSILVHLDKLINTQKLTAKKSNNEIAKSFARLDKLIVWLFIAILCAMLSIGYFMTQYITNRIGYIKNIVLQMSEGVLPSERLATSNCEIGEITSALNRLIHSFRMTSKFARKIGNGEFNESFKPLSNKDILGNSLLEMRHSLVEAKDRESKQNAETNKSNWASAGLAQLSNLLGQEREIYSLSISVSRFIMNYIGAIQAGLFIYHDSDENDIHLELISAIAYNREKSIKTKYDVNDGLLGDCAIERKTKYLSGLPEHYIKVTSAFIQSSPRTLLIVPMIAETKLIGIMEFTALAELSEEKIAFAEKTARRIAFTIASIQGNIQTVKLLEQSQIQSSQLAAQEEELRQNLEELRATQEEMIKTQKNLEIANSQLKQNEEQLEEKVRERTAEVVSQKEMIEQKNRDITASISYASRIQTAMLTPPSIISKHLKQHFILWKPRDIVSGDFYWMKEVRGKTYIVAADCTGHGVPGAFMSMLGIAFLNDIVRAEMDDDVSASDILNELRNRVKLSLGQRGIDGETQDGMDMALCIIEQDKRSLQFAGAYNPLLILRDGELFEYKGQRMPIGIHRNEKPFISHKIEIQTNDTIYIFSDGYIDQFGGKTGKKFMPKPFKRLLTEIHWKPMEQQQKILEKTLKNWQGETFSQIDDILVVGVRV